MLKLKIEGLSCSIKNKEILKDITVSFQQGEMAAVLGRKGAGKTTFIRCIANLIAHQGSIVLVSPRRIVSKVVSEDVIFSSCGKYAIEERPSFLPSSSKTMLP